MNGKQIAVLIVALAVIALILWRELPIEYPMVVLKIIMLFVKTFIVLALASVAYLFAGSKKSS
jgi:hypothetical protein